MRWCLACALFISFFLTDSDTFIIVLLAERSGMLDFSHWIERKLMRVKLCCAASTHGHWIICTCRSKELSFPRGYNTHLSICTKCGHAASRKQHLCGYAANAATLIQCGISLHINGMKFNELNSTSGTDTFVCKGVCQNSYICSHKVAGLSWAHESRIVSKSRRRPRWPPATEVQKDS